MSTWAWEYLSHRIGPRHPFLTYPKSDPHQGVYQLAGGDEIRIALAGDWATGTDEAESVAQLIAAFAPHYSIHLGDVYYVGGGHEVDENFLGINNPNNGYDPACGRTDHTVASRSTATTKCMPPAMPISTACCRGSDR